MKKTCLFLISLGIASFGAIAFANSPEPVDPSAEKKPVVRQVELEQKDGYVILPAGELPEFLIQDLQAYSRDHRKIKAVYQGQLLLSAGQREHLIAILMDGKVEDISGDLREIVLSRLPEKQLINFVKVEEDGLVREIDLPVLKEIYRVGGGAAK